MRKTRRLLSSVFLILCCWCSHLLGSDLKKKQSSQTLEIEWYNTTYSYWPFENFWLDDIVPDFTGTNNGKINGNVRRIPGMVGSALHLVDSSLDFGSLPGTCFNDPMSCKTGFAIAFWLKIPNFKGNKIIIQMAKSRNARGFTVWTRRHKRNKLHISVNGKDRMYRSEAEWSSDYWTHVAIVWHRQQNTLEIYYNCTLHSTAKRPQSSNGEESIEKGSLVVGATNSNKKHSMAQIDELALWNRTIERKEICRIVKVITVHGGYSPWSNYTECSQTCGNGTRTRLRTCTNPEPKNKGNNCSQLGPDYETLPCINSPCPIHGNFSKWKKFTRCTKPCGGGKKFRSRECNNPVPKFGGRNCSKLGPFVQSSTCNLQPCPIHGGFTEWSDYSECSKSCENGTSFIHRNCTNPRPQYGGRNCSGPTRIYYPCNTHMCPIDGGYTQWSNFTRCSKSCGKGVRFRHRNCTNPIPQYYGKTCKVLGPAVESIQCNTHPCPIDGRFTNWSKFSKCSKTCGNGTRFRRRQCTNPAPKYNGKNCTGKDYMVESCNTHECPIDGGYTAWSNFTECTTTCGGGTQIRYRTCTNPVPKFNGMSCLILGPEKESRLCNSNHCPINGGYTTWSEFSRCSKLCGNGTKYRFRNCTRPVPQYGGNNCTSLGKDIIFVACNTHRCPIHGGFTNWSNFTDCTKSCGNGTKYRFRNCSDPTPKYGGRSCVGPYRDILSCNKFPCSIDGGYTEWTEFGNCTKPCGNGTKHRTRNCTNPSPLHGGKNCSRFGKNIDSVFCNSHLCPIHGGYTAWSSFSECTKSCGVGEQIRYRNCSNPYPQHGGRNCTGDSLQKRVCNTDPCPVDGGYSNWEIFEKCTKSCGNGTRLRIRHCNNPKPDHGGISCDHLGDSFETKPCNEHHCPIHGNYSSWSKFSKCSKSCEGGSQNRYRTCTNPKPKYGGKDCSHIGSNYETRSCNTHFCPVHGNYSSWTNFTECDKSCGNGTSYRTRDCTNPVPKHGGRNCSHIGPDKEVRLCNTFPCPIDGGYTLWSEFAPCDRTCGNGTKFRTRNCTNPSPQFGGKNCSRFGPQKEIVSCFLRFCPVDGKYGNWSEFGPCSKSCNNGTQNRTRVCDSPSPQHGGKVCEGSSVEIISCNSLPCPIHGGYAEWSEFSKCSKTCDGGVKIRTRNCSNPEPKYGGRNCTGLGPSEIRVRCNIQRCPDIVFNITLNLTREKWSPKLADPSSEAFRSLKYSIQNNIKSLYATTGHREISKVEVWRIRQGSVLVDVLLKYYNGLYKGVTVLQDAIYTDHKLGNYPVMAVSLFTEDVPFSAPVNFSGYNMSSTSVMLSWGPVSQEFTNGNITGYRISYTIERSRVRREIKTPVSIMTPNHFSYLVTNLNKFTDYEFRIAATNKRGIGLDSEPIVVRTDQDKPLKPPPSVSAKMISSRSISVSWSAILKQDIQGYLQGYTIYYNPVDHQAMYNTTSVGRHDLKTQISGLERYTMYRIQVSGFTIKGDGPTADAFVRTDEDVPSKPPPKVTVHNTSSTSIIVQWTPIPEQFIHGILKGYIIDYHVAAKSSFNNWKNVTTKDLSTSKEIVGLNKYTEYVIQVSGYTVKGEGMVSKAVNVWTDEDVPEAYPTNFTGVNTSSTELYLEWQTLEDKEWNGKPLGYTIFYIPLTKNIKHYIPAGYKKQEVQVKSHATFVTLENLYKYTWYEIQIAAFTSKGLGPISPTIKLRTSEDVPSKSAIQVSARFTSHTSLLVEWKSIPEEYVHGILLGFRIQYWIANKLKDEKMEKIGPASRNIELKNLLIYTKYAIRILGFTYAGDGEKSRIIYATTDQYMPGAPPENLKAHNKTSPTKIKVQWQPIKDPYDVHGILLGYKVYYKAVAVANETIRKQEAYTEIIVNKTSVVLDKLDAFTRYHIYILAYTIKGNGETTHVVAAETCNCYRMLHTNWWPSPPYVETPGSDNHSGIIPPVIEGAVKFCCENCGEYKQTIVNYTKTPYGKPAMKKGLQEFKENIDDGELSFPVYGFLDQKVYSGSYGFAPLVQSPGVAMIVIGDEEGTAAGMLIRSIILCWPIVFLDIVLLWVLSIVIWFVETFHNSRHFPHNMLQGTWEGMWWAFASMTTLGYGDRIPRTPIGRVICIVWILIGVILIACFNSTMTSVLTARILEKNVILYGTKIAAIQNSSEYRFGVRKNAYVNPSGRKYENLEEIYDALINRQVRGILIDAFTAGSRAELFNRSDIRINKLYDYSAAYGVVLGGESKKLQKCFHTYLSEQRSYVSDIIQKNTHAIKESGKKLSVQRAQSLFDPKFPTYLKTVIICASLLVLVFLVGCKFQCAKKIGWIAKTPDKSKKYTKPTTRELILNKNVLRKEMSYIVEVFYRNCQRRLNYLKYKHLKELQHLMKLKQEEEYEPVQKGSFTKHNLWTVQCKSKGKVFSTTMFKRQDNRNGQSNGFALNRFKTPKEKETIV